MGEYYGVKCIKAKGTQVSKFDVTQGYAKLEKSDHIIAIMNNGLYSIAPDVTKRSVYKDFNDDYKQGHWLRMDLYKVTEEVLGQCPDQGRDYSSEF